MRERIMLKISGEQLGSTEYNFDNTSATRICEVIESIAENGYSVACIVGGGNIVRGEKLAKNGFNNQVVADQMGMLATLQNGLFLNETLNSRGKVKSSLFSNIEASTIAERFSYRRVDKLLAIGRIVLIGGGLGKPGFTTDTAVVAQAFELHCGTIVKTTKVDGVYSADPLQVPNAKRFEHINYDDVLANPDIQVMDKAAIAFASAHGQKLAICKPDPESVLSVLKGETHLGTIISGNVK